MTSFADVVFSPGGIALRVYSLALLIAQLYVVTDVFFQHRGWKVRLPAMGQLLLGLGWLILLLDGSYRIEWIETPRVYPRAVTQVYAFPWLAILAAELALTALLAASVCSLLRYRRTHLSRGVIKETLDMLPAGVCFSKADGTVALSNLKMDGFCAALTGGSLVDARAFLETIAAVGEPQNKARLVRMPGGEVVMFQEEEILSGGRPYTQLIAFDVTRQYEITELLLSKNKKLTDLQTRIKAYSAMVTQLAMNEEILRARVTVHDEMGYLLLSGKYYLDHEDTADAENLLRLERYTHRLLMREGEEPDDAVPDEFTRALAIAGAIGVKVTVEGVPPTAEPARTLLGSAIRECAANVKKHAGGDAMRITFLPEEGKINAVFSGNGAAPQTPVIPTGGLKNLRIAVEKAGGELRIRSKPGVTVTVILPA